MLRKILTVYMEKEFNFQLSWYIHDVAGHIQPQISLNICIIACALVVGNIFQTARTEPDTGCGIKGVVFVYSCCAKFLSWHHHHHHHVCLSVYVIKLWPTLYDVCKSLTTTYGKFPQLKSLYSIKINTNTSKNTYLYLNSV